MVLFGPKFLYSGKVVVFGQNWFYPGRSGSIRAKLVVFGQSGCLGKIVKVVVFGQSGCIQTKDLVFG